MKTLAIAVIATAVSFGAVAQMKPAASAPMAAPMAASSPMKSDKMMKKHAKKPMKAASAM